MNHPVLIVEDDEDIRESLMDLLEDHGYLPIGACDGREALDKLGASKQLPCVIVLDLMMPVMDGVTFREEQLRNPLLSGIPIIVISAYKDTPDTANTLNANSHLPKPINLKAFLQVVKEHCPHEASPGGALPS